MAFKVVSGAGVGAAAVVVGLSLAGPQALGVAAADPAAADSTSAAAGPADPSAVSGPESSPARAAAGRGGRGVGPSQSVVSGVRPRASADATSAQQTPAVEAARRSVRGSVSARSVAAVADRRKSVAVTPPGFDAPVPSVPVVVSGGPEVAVAVPSAAAVVADPARVPARAQRGSATRAAVAGDSVTVPEGLQYVVESVSGNILDSLHNFFTSASTWLATLPEGPVRDFLGGALLLVRRTVFPSGPNPFGSGYGTYRPPTEIAPDFDTAKFAWYDVAGGTPQSVLGPVLEGTDGAVMQAYDGDSFGADGVQGMITNMTGKPIVVQIGTRPTVNYPTSMAILFPNEWMPYRLISTGTLQFYPIDLTTYNPSTLPERPEPGLLGAPNFANLYLQDPYLWYQKPFVVFWANRRDGQGGVRRDFDEGNIADFSGQDETIQLRVRRQDDGWQVPASPAYLHRYLNPNRDGFGSDYTIFNIDVRRL